ncbi:thioredoxin family protein [Schizosaccharomyces japonicus yFS275]|uniref:Thioredoxin family protein n=1 Tax=Schizosaccharomyces japonicus (strain yFS275 / FY16936) TaxID=402676 RepID=B6K5S0_SCHJY|nr:thioredoxin family protein [Schizosaccharomyces japonicus yFS275]EEB08874.1 thioredoxin family protein [Schizosaccharomyces japonicus yFS275]
MRIFSSVFWLALVIPALALFSSSSPVIQLNDKTFEKSIATSPATLVLFYAPWCGYCQKFAPTYEKLATRLKSIIPVVAVDCNEESNKQLCSRFEVTGFPTVKMVTFADRFDQSLMNIEPRIHSYNGARDFASLKKFVAKNLPHRIRRITSVEQLDDFISSKDYLYSVILVSEKPKASMMYKSLSNYFPSVQFAQARLSDKLPLSHFPDITASSKSNSTLLFYNPATESYIPYEGPNDFLSIRDFVDTNTKNVCPLNYLQFVCKKNRCLVGFFDREKHDADDYFNKFIRLNVPGFMSVPLDKSYTSVQKLLSSLTSEPNVDTVMFDWKHSQYALKPVDSTLQAWVTDIKLGDFRDYHHFDYDALMEETCRKTQSQENENDDDVNDEL